jgi:hypothetical protein
MNQAISERGFAVIDVRDDGKISNVVHQQKSQMNSISA